MRILRRILFVLVMIVMIPQVASASEIDKIGNIINPNRHRDDSVSKRIMQDFKANLSFTIRQVLDENNATFKITVLDKKNRPMPEVELTVTDVETGKSRENQTNEKEEIRFRGLAPTEHTIKAISAPSGYFFDEDVITLENNVVNTKTISGKAKEGKDKTYEVTYRIADKYGIALREIEVKLQSGNKKYISKTDVFGYARLEVEDTGKYEVYVDKMGEYFEGHDDSRIDDTGINPNSEESIYSSQISEKMKKEFESALIINVKKADKPQEKVLVSLEGRRTDVYAFQCTNEEGKVVLDSLFPGNYVFTVNSEDRLAGSGVGAVHLMKGQVRKFGVVLSQSDLSKKSFVVEEKEPQDEKLPESGSKDKRMMTLFSSGMIVLVYLYLNKQKRKI